MKILIVLILAVVIVTVAISYVENARKTVMQNEAKEYKNFGMFLFLATCNFVVIIFVAQFFYDESEMKNIFYRFDTFFILFFVAYASMYMAIFGRLKNPKVNIGLKLILKKWKIIPTIMVRET